MTNIVQDKTFWEEQIGKIFQFPPIEFRFENETNTIIERLANFQVKGVSETKIKFEWTQHRQDFDVPFKNVVNASSSTQSAQFIDLLFSARPMKPLKNELKGIYFSISPG